MRKAAKTKATEVGVFFRENPDLVEILEELEKLDNSLEVSENMV